MILDLSATCRTVPHHGHHAHRAPDPAPIEEPPPDPFEPADPHQPPIRTPQNDEPPVDPNPSVTFH
jgi:hypothetical protein